MSRTNILFTCAGRRNYLVQYFQRALNGNGMLLAGDASPSAPALAEADLALTLPRIDEPDYVDRVLSIVRKYSVQAVLSLNDLELPLLAENKKKFEDYGCQVLVSDPVVIDICFDKLETIHFANRIGIETPQTYTTYKKAVLGLESGEIDFPLVVKPRWGSASIGLEFPRDKTELYHSYELLNYRLDRTMLKDISKKDRNHAILIQNKIKGKEYGVDVVNNLQKEHQAVIVKKKLSMRAGETDKAMTVDHPGLRKLGSRVGENLGHIGNLDCDFFETEEGELYLLEMNPRFGGGYPFSHEAGADLPAAILQWLEGKEAAESCFHVQFEQAFAKYDLLKKVKLS